MLNKTKAKDIKKENLLPKEAHENYMGGPSYDLSPFTKLYVMSVSAFFGENGYYEDVRKQKMSKAEEYLSGIFGSFGLDSLVSGKNRAEAMCQAIEDSLAYDTELTLRFLGWLRTKALMRATPAVGLAVASRSDKVRGTGLLSACSDSVLSRLDDVTNCLAYYLDSYGKPLPMSLRKALAKRISNATEYELAKYAGKNKSVSLEDAISLLHPHSDAIDKFCKGELSQTKEGMETWEGIISKEGSNKKTWEKAIGVMGHMALLRNLRNFEKHGVPTELYLDKLVKGVKTGKQLPFRYYSAYQNVTNGKIKDALEECIDISIANLPKLGGKSLILVDNSGSAVMTRVSSFSSVSVSTVGNLMGVLTGMISESGTIGVFGDKIEYFPVYKNSGRTALATLHVVNTLGETVGEATENGIWLALGDAIKGKIFYDRILIYSDMQAGHGGLYGIGNKYPMFPREINHSFVERYIDVPKLVEKYREKVNPDCKLYSIQIGGYSDNIFPELYPNTCIIGGWSTETLRFITLFEKDPKSVESYFRAMFGLGKE